MSARFGQGCHICRAEMSANDAYDVSDGREPASIVKLCPVCSASERVVVEVDGLQVEVDRADYLRADHGRLSSVVDRAQEAFEDAGWRLFGVRVEGASDEITEPLPDG